MIQSNIYLELMKASEASEASEAYNLFYRGDYSKIAELTVDCNGAISDKSLIPPTIGALTFLGRINEAEILFEKYKNNFSKNEFVFAAFFLGVVTCRHFNFVKSQGYFADNAKALKSAKASSLTQEDLLKLQFFTYQGFGFYRYTYGHLKPALRSAEKAYQSAFKGDFLFGRLFAQDLKSHILINLGKTHLGLRGIEQNIRLAKALGRGALVQMFRATLAIYRSRYGISANAAIEELLSTLSETTFEDGYSRACLLAAISEQYILRGNAIKAQEALDEACSYVYQIDNPRLEILLNFRIAYVLYQRGESGKALHLIGSSSRRLKSNIDRILELRVKGLEHRLNPNTELLQWIVRTTKKTNYFTAQRILDRQSKKYLSLELQGQDPLGDLIDKIALKKESAVEEILEKGWYGLLYDVYKISRQEKTLAIGVQGKSLTFFNEGNVLHFPHGATNQVAKFLLFLSDGEKSKEEIIQSIWQQDYHPLRHDPLLYTLVSKLRKELGFDHSWVESTERGYQLQNGIQVIEISPEAQSKAFLNLLPHSPVPEKLTYRQNQILNLIKTQGSINVGLCAQSFQISLATANRDLVNLEKENFVSRSGKGRATVYHLKGESHA